MFCRQIWNHKSVIILNVYLSGSHQFFCVIGFFCNPGFDSNRTALGHDEYDYIHRLDSRWRDKYYMAPRDLYHCLLRIGLC